MNGCETSTPSASPVRCASITVVSPHPQPTSSTRSPRRGASFRSAASPNGSIIDVSALRSDSQRFALASFHSPIIASFAVAKEISHRGEEALRLGLLHFLRALGLRSFEVDHVHQVL